ncbi:unnamed protein product, partial [Rotaria sp. Silwood2]
VNNHHNPDAYTNVMQGQALLNGNQLPKIIWNQIKILIISNKDLLFTSSIIMSFMNPTTSND